MTHGAWLRDDRRILFQVAVFTLCCCLAVWIRAIVAADTLSDLASVTLQIGTVLAFIGAAAVALPAGRHARNRTERIALRILPVGVLIVAGMFVKTTYADVSVALYALTTKDDGSTTDIVLGPGGRDLRLSGSITEGAANTLAALLNAHPGVERIHLTSDGGLADEGELLRKVIAAHHLTTFVPDYCVSACTLAFMGGHERIVMEGARLGFHAPYEEGLFDQTFAGDSSPERASYLASGVAPAFVDRAFRVKPDDIWTPDADQLLSAHVATGVVDRYRFPDSNLDGMTTKAGARSLVLTNFPLARAIESWKPQAVDVLAAWYLDAYNRGLSEGEIVDQITAIIGGAATLAMASADDETLVGFGQFIDAAMEAAESDEDCAAIGGKASLIKAESLLSQDDEDADRQAVSLLSEALQKRLPHGVGGQKARTIATTGAHPPCAQIRDFYAHALRMPRHDAAAVIRTLVARPIQESAETLALVGAVAH